VKWALANTIIIESKQPLLERLKRLIDSINAEIGIDKAFLFGSTAKGTRHQNSDVDLIVVSDGFSGMPEPKRLGFLQHRWRYIEDLEALAYTTTEFNKVKNRTLMRKILAYAIDLTPEKKKP
jgi:predicted nucleotidyltransferase